MVSDGRGGRGKREGHGLTPLEGWARCVAAGVPDELYWQCTPPEIEALLTALADRDEQQERSAVLRAGLVASAVYNVHRKKGSKALRPEDFLRKKRKILSPEEFADVMSTWADTHNQKAEA